MIDVIIPAFNAKDSLDKTLSSIILQNCSSLLNIYIINDCSNYDYSEFIKYYSKFINIKEIRLDKNSGPGYAREVGIENSNSEYIIFIDSDDILYNRDSINILYSSIKNSDYDIVVSKFYGENVDKTLVEYDNSYVWLHGKIYRRSFIEKNMIVFNNNRYNEDLGFNYLCYVMGANILDISDFTYVWCYNDNSVTRKLSQDDDSWYVYDTQNYIDNMGWVIKKCIECSNFDIERFSEVLYTIYLWSFLKFVQCPKFFEEKIDCNILKDLLPYFKKYEISDELKFNIANAQLFSSFSSDSLLPLIYGNISFPMFLERIEKELI